MTDLLERTKAPTAPVQSKTAPTPARRAIVNARSLSDQDRAQLVAESLDVAHVGRFAHSRGILSSTLSSWRSRAREGGLPVSDEIRARLDAEMTRRAYAPRRSGGRSRRLSSALASAAVITSLDDKKPAAETAAFFGISVGQLSQLRARARDGLIEIPASERKLLDGQMLRRVARKKAPGEAPAKPRRASKPRAPVATPLLSTIMEAKPEPVHAIVVSNDTHRVEIPSHLEGRALRDAIDHAMAALAAA